LTSLEHANRPDNISQEYIEDVMDAVFTAQPALSMCYMSHVKHMMGMVEVNEEDEGYLLSGLTMLFAHMLKSIYNQNEVNELNE
jgi:hypothetical protein